MSTSKPYKSTGVKYRSEEWYEKRRQLGLGGSEAAAVAGFTPYSSAFAVYWDKVGERKPIEENEAMRQGSDLEDYVAQRFCEATGKRVKKNSFMLQSVEHPYMLADVDRLVVGENAILECKCTLNRDNYSYEDASSIPAYHLVQCLHYMSVVGADKCYLATLVYGKGFYIVEINYSDYVDDINALIAMEKRFWNDNVKAGVPPMPDGSDSSSDTLLEQYPESNMELPPVDLEPYTEQLKRLVEVKKEAKRIDEEQKSLENLIKQSLGETAIGESDQYYVSWKSQNKTTVDSKALKAEMPEVYARYAKTSSTRVFRLTEKN